MFTILYYMLLPSVWITAPSLSEPKTDTETMDEHDEDDSAPELLSEQELSSSPESEAVVWSSLFQQTTLMLQLALIVSFHLWVQYQQYRHHVILSNLKKIETNINTNTNDKKQNKTRTAATATTLIPFLLVDGLHMSHVRIIGQKF